MKKKFELRTTTEQLEKDMDNILERDIVRAGSQLRKLREPHTISKYGKIKGRWQDSVFIPNDSYIPLAYNPQKQTMGQIKERLHREYGIQFEGIPYGDAATIQTKICMAHSGASEEKMECILAVSDQCSQLGILVYIVRIGKHINIKFYTLFLPTNARVDQQKQQALSLYNKLSPSVSMWESSMKNTVLTGMQQVLNDRGQESTATDEPAPQDEPVF